jgi:lipoprotein-anchoring transpeptidase ErfK/SrfK
MKTCFNCVIALLALLSESAGIASETRVIINLSDQRASLVEQGRITLVSPIASGKPGWSTPTGNFSIFNKDIDHRSRSFGSVVDADGRVVNSNATPSSYVTRGGHFRLAPMPYFMEFSPMVGMHAGYLPGYPASHGCVRMPRDLAALFFERVRVGTPVTVIGSTQNLARVRRALPILPTGSYVLRQRDGSGGPRRSVPRPLD